MTEALTKRTLILRTTMRLRMFNICAKLYNNQCMYVRTYVRTYVRMYVCMYVCMYACNSFKIDMCFTLTIKCDLAIRPASYVQHSVS
jgi:hypothetical protein